VTADGDARARTHLANERTFLAWFRTGITLVALGLAGAQLLGGGSSVDRSIVLLLATLVVVTGGFLIMVGLVRYRVGRRRIDAGDFRPAWGSIVIAGTLAVVVSAVAVVFVWLLQPGS
jgi:putative membrane protein